MRVREIYRKTPAMAETLQDRLRARMADLNLTENGLAVRAGLSRDAVRNIFRGKSEHPRSITLQALAVVLRCSVQWLIDGTDTPPSLDLRQAPYVPPAPPPEPPASRVAAEHGARLRRLRMHFDGGSPGRAADAAGVAPAEWEAMEEGRTPICTVSLSRFCEHHQIGPSYVVTGSLDALPSPVQRALAQAELAEIVAQVRTASAQQAEHPDSPAQTHTPDNAKPRFQAE